MKRLNILMCFLVLTGCASIIRDNTQIVPIQANVENAKIEVTNSSGAVVYSGQTPTTVYLKSSKSGYFNPENILLKPPKTDMPPVLPPLTITSATGTGSAIFFSAD